VHEKAAHQIIFRRARDFHRQALEVAKIVGHRPDVKDAFQMAIHEQQGKTSAAGHGAHERPRVVPQKINFREQHVRIRLAVENRDLYLSASSAPQR
jgi:hypothetical protein